jgi:hypothetical protein
VGRAVVVSIFIILVAASTGAGDDGCPTYADRLVEVGRTPVVLPELSGLVASLQHRDIYWAHNDSGHPFALYAMRENGAVVATFPLRGATASDPEDVGLGPCGPTDRRTCIYIGDIGDNLRMRKDVQLVRVVEPTTLSTRALAAEAIRFIYPDGAHDAEAVLVDPRTAAVYVVIKSLVSLGDLYRIDVDAAPPRRAVHVAALHAEAAFDSLVTAGSVHPSGTRVLLRTYRHVWEFRRPDARTIVDVLRTEPRSVPSARHMLGEAAAYAADGRRYVLGGEGVGSTLFRVECRISRP